MNSEPAEIHETLALLSTPNQYDEDQLRELVLFVGITGSGKSTVCQFLAENPNLMSKRDGVSSDFYISDGDDKISESTTVSKTLFPELLSLPHSNVTIADCPGFANTRGPQHDIAATVITKQLLDKAKNVKIVLVTPHHAVRNDLDRTAFTSLLSHVGHFIKDIDKFRDSIVLLVTKVENQSFEDDDGNFRLVDDNTTIDQIKDFLESTKVALDANIDDVDTKRRRLLLDILSREKIGIFRRPGKVGALNTDKRLIKQRAAIIQMMNHNMIFTHTRPDDFGLTLSDDSEQLVSKLQQAIENNQTGILNKYLADLSALLKLKIGEAMVIEDFKWILNILNQLIDFFEDENGPNLSIAEFLQDTQDLADQGSVQTHNDWQKQSEFALFLESIARKREVSKEVNDFSRFGIQLNSFKDILVEIKKFIAYKAEKIMNQSIGNSVTDIMAEVSSHLENLKITPFSNLTKTADDTLELFETFSQKSAEFNTFQEFVVGFYRILRNLNGFSVSPHYSQQFQSFQTDITNMKTIADQAFLDGHQDQWFQALRPSMENLNSIVEWYNFILNMDTVLSTYENQQNLLNSNINITNWNEFRVFAQKLKLTGSLTKQLRTRSALDPRRQALFNSLIEFATKKPTHSCEASKLIVTGNFIRISQVIAEFIPKCASFNELYLFSAQTVFIDATLNAASKNVYLIAPKWHILGDQIINLRGRDRERATSVWSIEAGEPGGNFVGIGGKFIDEKKLTVDVSGGQGADGIDGAEGYNGLNGETYDLEHVIKQNWNCGNEDEKWRSTKSVLRYPGSIGHPGWNGEDGSQPGLGGKSGSITMKNINNEPLLINLLHNEGTRGLVGKGGKGGVGGYHGKVHIFLCKLEPVWFFFHFDGHRKIYETMRLENMGKAPDGKNGRDGRAGTPKMSADPAKHRSLPDVAVEYKQYFAGQPLDFGRTQSFIGSHYFTQAIRRRKRSMPQTPPLLMTNAPSVSSGLLTVAFQQPNAAVKPSFPCENFSLSSIVQLADLVIRKFKKITPKTVQYSSDTATDWDRMLVQAEVLQIIEKSELEHNEQQENNPEVGHFDPLPLLKKLRRMHS